MKSISTKMDSLYFSARSKASALKNKAKTAFLKEDGDTNFISILIVLAIVLVVALVFFALKDRIIDWVEDVWDDFTSAAGTADNDRGNEFENVPG